MRVLNEYPGSHHYVETWDPENWFCPNCGKQGHIWTASQGDYYSGCESICTSCESSFYLQGGSSYIKEENEKKILEQLKTGQTYEPTTRRGA